MRLSINKNDPGYRPPQVCKQYRVFLDDKELFDCETADEERGFVIRTWPTRHPVTRKKVMQRSGLIRGVVKIVRRDAPQTVVVDETVHVSEPGKIDAAEISRLCSAVVFRKRAS